MALVNFLQGTDTWAPLKCVDDTTHTRFLFCKNYENIMKFTLISTVRGDWINANGWVCHIRCKLFCSSVLDGRGCHVLDSNVTVPLGTWLKLIRYHVLTIPDTQNLQRISSFYINQAQPAPTDQLNSTSPFYSKVWIQEGNTFLQLFKLIKPVPQA